MSRLPSTLLLLVLSACVRESTAPAAQTQPAPLPSPPPATVPQSEVQKLPPAAAQPELATPPEPGTEKGARAFVTSFLQARAIGDERQARTFLSPIARDQYDKGEGGLSLLGTNTLTGWDFVSVNAIDANSFEVKVKIREAARGRNAGVFEETFFVGPGQNLDGAQQPWVIRGAMREG